MKQNPKKIASRMLVALSGLAFTALTQASWTLNSDQSRLDYLSTKVMAGGTASFVERNHFAKMSGAVDADGSAKVMIDLNSVETNVPIRNERMQEHVFNTVNYPAASLTTQVPPSATEPGKRTLDLAITLDMNGHSKTMNIPVHVSATESSMTVTPAEIVLVNAADFGMVDGLNKLTEIMALSHIPAMVPVTFELAFDK